MKYCSSLTKYSRYKTREVKIGDVPLGGDNPIRIQSMTTTDTMNTTATVEQTIRMVDAGCEYVRITAPSLNEAKNLEEIKKELRRRGCTVPLIADIHFTPNAAELAARIVEKVRINPGNYADKKKFEIIDYTDETYEIELERIRKRFTPLVKICIEYGTAIRIGVNHGSLSDRIMSRYGDTPIGMVESALEFVRICADLNYHDIVLSMKSSNPQVMVQAYRLLVEKMSVEGMNYPLHLGVTEAGGGEDGRIKSAVGIGTLLEDGLGDTIRVSLTEDPEHEAPAAILLADRYKERASHKPIIPIDNYPINPFEFNRRNTFAVSDLGGSNVPRVVADYNKREISEHKDISDLGYTYIAETDKWNMSDTAADFIYLGTNPLPFDMPHGLKGILNFNRWKTLKNIDNYYPLYSFQEYIVSVNKSAEINFVVISVDDIVSLNSSSPNLTLTLDLALNPDLAPNPALNPALINLKNDKTAVLVLETNNLHGMAEQRRAFAELILRGIQNPVIIKRRYSDLAIDQLMLYSATDFGALLIDGLGDGVWIEYEGKSLLHSSQSEGKEIIYSGRGFNQSNEKVINRILFGILQAARARISKTEYIACPSCGRTLFDLQETTELIRSKTEHLKGVKIAIMGCIVNGPGEMADADYGYVGSGPGKITLYRGKEVVKRNVTAENAVDSLINLIKEDNNWVEKE